MTLKVDVMRDQSLRGKRVLIREDLNVPIKTGVVASDARLRAALPTIRHAVEAGAKVILMSHLGRPVEGDFDSQFSLAPVADHLAGLLDLPVSLISDWRGGVELGDLRQGKWRFLTQQEVGRLHAAVEGRRGAPRHRRSTRDERRERAVREHGEPTDG